MNSFTILTIMSVGLAAFMIGMLTYLSMGMPRVTSDGDVVAYTNKPSRYPITINGQTYEEQVAESNRRINTNTLLDGKVHQCDKPFFYKANTCWIIGNVENYTLNLYNPDNPDQVLYSKKVDNHGNFLFDTLPPGKYMIKEAGALIMYGNTEEQRANATAFDSLTIEVKTLAQDMQEVGIGGRSLYIYLPIVNATTQD